jgi:hypothetical protein
LWGAVGFCSRIMAEAWEWARKRFADAVLLWSCMWCKFEGKAMWV